MNTGPSLDTVYDALQAAQAGTWEWNLRTDELRCSPEIYELLQLRADQPLLTYSEWERFVEPDDRILTRNALTDAIKTGGRVQVEFRVNHPVRGLRWLLGIARIERAENGTASRVVGMIIDVTDRRRAEEALRESEARLRRTMDHMLGFIGELALDGTLTDVNRAALEAAGLERAEVIGRKLWDTYWWSHDDVERERLRVAVRRATAGETVRYDMQARVRGNRLLPIDFQLAPVRDHLGRVTHLVPSSVSILERKRAEMEREESLRALEVERARLIQILEQLPIGVSIAEYPSGRLLFQNPEGMHLLGHPFRRSETYRGYAQYGATHPDGRPFRAEEYPIARALLSGEIVKGEEIRYRRGDDSETYLAVDAAPIYDLEGRVVAVVTTYADILRRKLAEDALRAADQRKDEFLATLAHELRNPLAPIRNAVQILRLRGPPIPELQVARDMIDRQVNQLVRLVDELLDLSRISTGRITLQMAPVDLRAALVSAVESVRPMMDSRRHELRVDLADDSVYVDGDPVRLTQVIVNLLDNAAKYTPGPGKIVLKVWRNAGHAYVSVRDNGIGLAPEDLKQIFEMFERVDTSAERLEGGLGIGLALVRKLVDLHGGTVHARSEGLGKGSEFVVCLPERPPPGIEHHERYASATQRDAPGVNRRVLVVDDNRDCAESMAMLLNIEGCTVRVAFSGEDALELGAEYRPDVIFMDLGMPILNGYETCRRLRAQEWGEEAFVIALTGWGQGEVRRLVEEAGFDLHLVKPIDPAQVRYVLETAATRTARA